MTPVIETRALMKSYGANAVLHGVSLSIARGEVVSIIGENGAGKSTLARIIAGVTTPDSGELLFKGQIVQFHHPLDAISKGIGIVHQELNLADNLTVIENLMLGREETRFGLLKRGDAAASALSHLHRLAPNITPETKVESLSTAQKQLIEIARALSVDAQLLIFDEPTSSLSERDADQLLSVIEGLREKNVSVIYVSHRLAEVARISDTVYALRDGFLSGKASKGEINRSLMIQMMIGRELKELYPYQERAIGAPMLELKNFRASEKHAPISFTVRAGEIVGISGLMGSGRTELLEAIYGVRTAVQGKLHESPQHAAQAGIGFVPESRKEQGLFLESTIHENVIISELACNRLPLLRAKLAEMVRSEELIGELSIKCQGSTEKVKNLSGGNQQKVVLAKWLVTNPRVLLLDEPTRGVDIGARRDIYALLFALAARGVAILFVSSELEEVIGISDRALVMKNGSLSGEINRAALSEETLMEKAA